MGDRSCHKRPPSPQKKGQKGWGGRGDQEGEKGREEEYMNLGPSQWLLSLIWAVGRLRQEDYREFEASLT